MYRIFDGVLDCDFSLPGIPKTEHNEVDILIRLGSGRANIVDFDWFHSWRESDGEVVLSCARKKDEHHSIQYLMRFPEQADFLIEERRKDKGNCIEVTCYPCAECREDTLRHLLLDQLLPRLWTHLGHLVLHASAVKLPNGHVIAFVGESGWGKSTLAAALQLRGAQLLSDDSVSLKAHEWGVELVPSYTGLRLLEDSIESLDLAGQDWTSVSHYSDKQRLDLTQSHETYRLDTLYVMTKPAPTKIVSMELDASAAMIASLIKYSFLLDINDSQCATRQLREIGSVVAGLANVRRLDYPRDYKQLPALCNALMEDRQQ
ncbi:MAG: hypothetical protein IMF06_03975 [Proteobacteria bacterium]|nr:hypothetical protein [Pseudomonadota bacterium]